MAGPSWKPLSPFLPPWYGASPSPAASILPPTTSCPDPSFPGLCSGYRHSHFSIFLLQRRLSLPCRPEVRGSGSWPQQVFPQVQTGPLHGASEKKRQSSGVGGGILERVARPSPQVSGRVGHSRTDQGAYPGAPAPTCARPGSRSPGMGGRGAGQTSCAPHPLSLPSFSPLWPVRGSHYRRPRLGEGWGGAAELGRR